MSQFTDKTKGTNQLAGGRGSIRYRIQAPVSDYPRRQVSSFMDIIPFSRLPIKIR